MSNFIANLFGSNKNKNNNEKNSEQSKTKDNTKNDNNDDDLPPVAIPRRLSLSKSGRLKEKKRSKLGLMNISRNETVVDGTTQKAEPSSKSGSRESLDKDE